MGYVVAYKPLPNTTGITFSDEALESLALRGKILKQPLTYAMASSVMLPHKKASERAKIHALFQRNPDVTFK